jgi:hypothetical protein
VEWLFPPLYRDCYFDGAPGGIHGRDFKHGDRLLLIALAVRSCVSAFRFGMTNKIEDFYRPLPCSLTLENFFHGNGFDVKRIATMRCSDGVFKFRNLFMRHSPNQTPSTRYFQFLLPSQACREVNRAFSRNAVGH